jgi:hypothetical protein
MQFRGKVPQASSEELEEAARHRGVRSKAPRSEREELQALFQATMQEVEDRKAFLSEMEANVALKRDHVHQVREASVLNRYVQTLHCRHPRILAGTFN